MSWEQPVSGRREPDPLQDLFGCRVSPSTAGITPTTAGISPCSPRTPFSPSAPAAPAPGAADSSGEVSVRKAGDGCTAQGLRKP